MAIVANMTIIALLVRVARLPSSRLAALLCLVVLAGTMPARAGTPIHLTLDRKIDGTTAPFFLAIDRGAFKDEGLDVTIDVAAGGPAEVFDRLAGAKADAKSDLAVSDLNLLIKFRDATGTPIKAVFALFDKPPYAVIARRSRGVAMPHDLQGKTLGAAATDPTFAVWPIFAAVAGIDAAKVGVERLGMQVCQPMLAAGEIDAFTGFSFTSYVDLKASGVPPDDLAVITMADHGVVLYGDAIMVAPSFAAQKPDAVRAFLRVYARALKDAVRDPASAIEALLRHNDKLNKDIELERLRMAIGDNIVTPAVKAYGFGGVEPDRFAAAIEQIALTYRFKAKDKAAATFDASYLPPAAER